ncbi:Uncharacterized protein TCM_007569 [Theobroma cacao]|uniref:Uncharacterized protein n=1 Tax=Theobroma cacao TaxID=3641 RepID=A0A061E1H5_THECC|nr:Uncharacterized protein TCM_007569 [Theobroma cacao]
MMTESPSLLFTMSSFLYIKTALPYSIQEHQSYPKRSAQPHDPNNQIATYHSYQERKKARDMVRDQRKLSRQHGLT